MILGKRGLIAKGMTLGVRGISGVGEEPFSFGNALKFDGVNDFVSLATSITMSGQHSFNVWVKFAAFKNFNTILGNTSLLNFLISRSSTNIEIGNGLGAFTVETMTENTWNMVTFTRNADNLCNIYLNGVKSLNEYTSSLNYAFNQIGRYVNSSSFLLDATLNEMAHWNSTLTQTQITNLYNSGSGDFATNYSPANLIAYWRMNGTAGDSTAIDEKGNYNGTLNNFDTSTCWVKHNEGIGYWVIGTTFKIR